MTKTIRTLLSYVRKKYPVFQQISIRFDNEQRDIRISIPAIGPLESDTLRTIRKLPSLTRYSIRFRSITDMIMEAMDETSIKLEGIKIWLLELDARRQFNFLLYSKQINSISELTIIDTIHYGRAISNNLLIFNLVTNLSRLTVRNLYTQSGSTTYSYKFLIQIIYQLSNFETLSIRDIYDDPEEFPVTPNTYPPKKSKLNNLVLHMTGTYHSSSYTNDLFKFIFQSCPALKTFELNGKLVFDRFACLSLKAFAE